MARRLVPYPVGGMARPVFRTMARGACSIYEVLIDRPIEIRVGILLGGVSPSGTVSRSSLKKLVVRYGTGVVPVKENDAICN